MSCGPGCGCTPCRARAPGGSGLLELRPGGSGLLELTPGGPLDDLGNALSAVFPEVRVLVDIASGVDPARAFGQNACRMVDKFRALIPVLTAAAPFTGGITGLAAGAASAAIPLGAAVCAGRAPTGAELGRLFTSMASTAAALDNPEAQAALDTARPYVDQGLRAYDAAIASGATERQAQDAAKRRVTEAAPSVILIPSSARTPPGYSSCERVNLGGRLFKRCRKVSAPRPSRIRAPSPSRIRAPSTSTGAAPLLLAAVVAALALRG